MAGLLENMFKTGPRALDSDTPDITSSCWNATATRMTIAVILTAQTFIYNLDYNEKISEYLRE